MRRPQHMSMRELIALPVLEAVEPRDDEATSAIDYGGAFRDDNGRIWGTLRTSAGWARYPAHLSVLSYRPRRALADQRPYRHATDFSAPASSAL